MALMKFREPNQVRRVGVRPAHDGTQVLERGSADNATVVLYTVPAGKVFYLCHAWLNVQGVAAGSVYLAIYDGVPAVCIPPPFRLILFIPWVREIIILR